MQPLVFSLLAISKGYSAGEPLNNKQRESWSLMLFLQRDYPGDPSSFLFAHQSNSNLSITSMYSSASCQHHTHSPRFPGIRNTIWVLGEQVHRKSSGQPFLEFIAIDTFIRTQKDVLTMNTTWEFFATAFELMCHQLGVREWPHVFSLFWTSDELQVC